MSVLGWDRGTAGARALERLSGPRRFDRRVSRHRSGARWRHGCDPDRRPDRRGQGARPRRRADSRASSTASPSPSADALHGVWLGHPVHPMLAQLPVGAWTSAAVLDVLALGLPDGRAARRRRPGGRGAAGARPRIAAPAAAAAGVADWSALLPGAAARGPGARLGERGRHRPARGVAGPAPPWPPGEGRLLGLLGVTSRPRGRRDRRAPLVPLVGRHANHAQSVPHMTEPRTGPRSAASRSSAERSPRRRYGGRHALVVVVRRGRRDRAGRPLLAPVGSAAARAGC